MTRNGGVKPTLPLLELWYRQERRCANGRHADAARKESNERMHSPMFAPVIAMVFWTFVMGVWLYATRIPALSRHKIVYDPSKPNDAFAAQIPPSVRWKADNYNNLMEQPPIFYAIALILAFSGVVDGITVSLTWAYVATRVAHSLVHALVNRVMVRFGLFALASVILLALTLRAAAVAFSI